MAISRIEWFVHTAKCTSADKIPQVCTNELDYLRANYEPSSMRRALTNYRNGVKNHIGDDHLETIILKCLVLSESECLALATAKEKQLSNDLLNLRPLYEIDRYIQTAVDLLSATSYQLRILGLCALTGRRAAEIGCTAKFEAIENDPLNVLFTGQLKTKGRGDLDAFTIPVFTDSAKIIKAIQKIRSEKPQFINESEKFHNAASKPLNQYCKKTFSFVTDSEIKVKDLRSIYGELGYMFNDDPTIAKQKYMSQILGHAADDNATGTSYIDFYIADQNYI
jgi:hypothetical protein